MGGALAKPIMGIETDRRNDGGSNAGKAEIACAEQRWVSLRSTHPTGSSPPRAAGARAGAWPAGAGQGELLLRRRQDRYLGPRQPDGRPDVRGIHDPAAP